MNLGKHGYDEAGRSLEQTGILDTCGGGFVDLGHALDAVDVAAYLATRAMDLLPSSGTRSWRA